MYESAPFNLTLSLARGRPKSDVTDTAFPIHLNDAVHGIQLELQHFVYPLVEQRS